MVRFPIQLGLAALLLSAPAVGRAASARITTATPPAPAGDFLYAIRMVESGNRYNCPPGPLGEQGPYQFRHSVWRQYTGAAFSAARTSYADSIAAEHYQWLVQALRRRGMRPNVWTVAAAWNGGLDNVVRGRIPTATRGYAARVVNLVAEEAQLRAAATPRFRIAYASP